jgi:hypothetical protein
VTKYHDWHIPLASKDITLEAALSDLRQARSDLSKPEWREYEERALMQRFTELDLPELVNFKNIDANMRDCLHILLGRGLLLLDEIFVVGLTLGSIKKVIDTEQSVNALVAKHLVPNVCRFDEKEMTVFKDAIRLAFISNCSPLDKFKYMEWLDQPLAMIRDAVGIEEELLIAYYKLESRRHPNELASRRLLPPEKKIVAF